MKRRYLIVSLLAVATCGLLNGCAHRRAVYVEHPTSETTVTREVVVTEAPPAPRVEEPIPAPPGDYEWVPGFWSWDGQWNWNPGKWTVRPHAKAVWEPGHWAKRGHGYVWIDGRWR